MLSDLFNAREGYNVVFKKVTAVRRSADKWLRCQVKTETNVGGFLEMILLKGCYLNKSKRFCSIVVVYKVCYKWVITHFCVIVIVFLLMYLSLYSSLLGVQS